MLRPAHAAAAVALAGTSAALQADRAAAQAAARTTGAAECAVHSLCVVPAAAAAALGGGAGGELLLVATRSCACYLITARGALVRAFASPSPREKGGEFTAATLSPRGALVYAASEAGELHVFDAATGRLEHTLRVTEGKREVVGIAHHPHRNLVATWSAEGALKLWRP